MKMALEAAASASMSLRVVVVDDSEVFRITIGDYLTRVLGVSVVAEVTNGQEAIAAVADLAPDLVLMDVRMPEMDGIEATQLIRRTANPPSIILVTAHDDNQALQNVARAVGAHGLLCKPQIATDLAPLLRGLFGEGKLAQPTWRAP